VVVVAGPLGPVEAVVAVVAVVMVEGCVVGGSTPGVQVSVPESSAVPAFGSPGVPADRNCQS
jgi:hypothetical protein